MTGAVTVSHLTRVFKLGSQTVVALDDVSVEILPGELTVAAGPSGSGKTTLLSAIGGLEATAGEGVREWQELSFVPQSLALLDELTVAENVELPARLRPAASGRPAAELLAMLDLAHLADRFPSQISGGEQQRTAIARAFRLDPAVLVADEPTGHQDRRRVDLVVDVMRQHAYAGNVVLLASHDEAVIAAADRVITLADGRIVSDTRAAGRFR
jgi:ABC-type lipoprotein export system ATPase subunit